MTGDGRKVFVYQLRLWLREISPAIWRRLLVRSDSAIADLHYTIQIVMGWTDFHLHQFKPKVKIVQNVGLCLHPSNYSHIWLLLGEIFVPSAINPRHQIWHTILTMRYRTTDLGEKRQNLVLPRSRIELQYCMQLLCPPSEHSGCWFSVKNILQMQII